MKKILCIVLLALSLSFTYSVSAKNNYQQNEYKQLFEKYLFEEIGVDTFFLDLYHYEELYMYYSNSNVTADEIEPNYILIRGYCSFDPMPTYEIIDNYVIETRNCFSPYEVPYFLIVPSEQKLYTIHEAFEANIECVENIFEMYNFGRLLGDMDKDRKLTIKDATYIQKCLVGIEKYPENDGIDGLNALEPDDKNCRYISDFNRDGERNVKDATAIQKYIAGLEY